MPRRTVTFASVAAGAITIAGSSAVVPINNACAARAEVSYAEEIAPIFNYVAMPILHQCKGGCIQTSTLFHESAKAAKLRHGHEFRIDHSHGIGGIAITHHPG